MKKTEVAVKCDKNEASELLLNELKVCNRAIQDERNFMKNGRGAFGAFSSLLQTKRDLVAKLSGLGVSVNQDIGMKPYSSAFFQSRGSAFSGYVKPKEEQVEKNISTAESNNLK